MKLRLVAPAIAAAAWPVILSCSKAPKDTLCQYEPLPASANISAGRGAVRTSAPTDEYFYVLDTEGKEVSHAHLNTAAALTTGDYDLKLNNSHHTVQVRANQLATCSAGTILTRGDTDEYYHVIDATGSEMAHHHLGSSVALFPGAYRVKVNGTTGNATVKPGVAAEIQTVTLTVPGSTDEYYYVLDSTGTELAHNHLGRPLAFLPGQCSVKLNNTATTISMAVGSPAQVTTGAVLLRGTTDEYYYVYDSKGTEVAHQRLNSALSFLPGTYTVRVNHTEIPAKADAGTTNEYQTATLTVNGKGNAYYYVLDKNGTELGHNRLNSPLALSEGSYSVKVGNDLRPVSLTASRATVVNW